MTTFQSSILWVTIDCYEFSCWLDFFVCLLSVWMFSNHFCPFPPSQLNTIGITWASRKPSQTSSWVNQQANEARTIGFGRQWDRGAATASRQFAIASGALARSQSAAATAFGDWKPPKSCVSWRVGKSTRGNSGRNKWIREPYRSALVPKFIGVFAERYSKIDKADDT